MKATELRIGNYYNQFENTEKVSWSTLKTLEESTTEQLWCKPIPLTEEWLLKFGFERTDLIDNSNDDWTWLFYQKDSIYIDGSDLTIETATGIVIKVEYVHQLQNLYFALTNEELILRQ